MRKIWHSLFRREDDDSHEFKPLLAEIESRPVNPLGRVIFWTVVVTIVLLVSWLCLGRIDVVVAARGKIIPSGEIKILQPLETGVISRIQCKPGDYVRKDQVLVEIDPSTTEPTLASAREKLLVIETEMARLDALLKGKPFRPRSELNQATLIKTQSDIHRTTIDGFVKLIDAKQKEVAKINADIQAETSGKEKLAALLEGSREKERRLRSVLDIIARDTYETVKNDITNYEKTIEETSYRIEGLTHRRRQLLDEIDLETSNFRRKNLLELAERQKGATDLKGEVDRMAFVNRKQQILSPIDGHVNEVYINTVGGVVTPAQKLLSIVPAGSPLIIEALILNQDRGFVREGMPAMIKVDAYEFQKCGTLKGTVRQISKDSITDERLGPVYKSYINPDEKELIVEGQRIPISSGLTVTAELKVGERRIIEFFVYPLIKYLDEGLSVR